MIFIRRAAFLISCVLFSCALSAQTYADRLGFRKGARVLILHVDDAGMSWESNAGAERALTEGVATSVSVMMPCPWVPGFVAFLKANPRIDAGLHLTLTSEWRDYRWGPLMGRRAVPGLTDTTGSLHASVGEVTLRASPAEVRLELEAQLERARSMGFEPTHLDSHMGTLFASPEFMDQYLLMGLRARIPVMMPGGHNTLIGKQTGASKEHLDIYRAIGQRLWAGGLPVLDDLHNASYDWRAPDSIAQDSVRLRAFATARYTAALKELKPGLTMMIMHCSAPSPVFPYISDSGPIRQADLLAMTDPAFRKALEAEGIILTTWREVMKRRTALKP